MTWLAINANSSQKVRARYQLALGAAPIGMMLAALAPLLLLTSWLEAYLGIPEGSPVKDDPNGVAFIAIFLVALVVLMLFGYFLGWCVNAFVSRYVLGWPADKVRAVYLHSQLPNHWLASNRK